MINTTLIGNKILSMSELEDMNRAEVKARKYKYCTINNIHDESFTAKVGYSETAGAWQVTEVLLTDGWVGVDIFDGMEEGSSYACSDYRNSI